MSQYPQYAPQPSNTFGLAGFIISLVGYISCGLLCPIGLLFSIIGLRKRPRGFAIAGFILGLIGSIGFLLFFLFGGLALLAGCGGLAALAPHIVTEIRLDEAREGVEHFYLDNHRFPITLEEATNHRRHFSAENLRDGWHHAFHYTTSLDGAYTISSDGPDGRPNSPDDLTRTGNVRP